MNQIVLAVIVLLLLVHINAKDLRTRIIGNQTFGNNEIMTESGIVRGHLAQDGDYIAFLGIPYAEPPTGHRRFKPPIPHTPWEGIFEANRTVKCPQKGEGNEDCLILNIFSPRNITDDRLAVLVYIHGGSFIIGAGQAKGVEPLIKENLIVVTLNYRLGALGFLCLGIPEAPGNAGLRDQHAALKWVHKNIANFGGDPNKVTLYGMSAGAASVEFQMLSKINNGLFQKAIVESGSSLTIWALDSDPIKTAMDLAKLLQFTDVHNNISRVLEKYLLAPVNQITTVNNDYYAYLTDSTFGFAPCLENNLEEIEPFIRDNPSNILKTGNYNKVPTMIFYSSLEGLFLRSEEYNTLHYAERMERNFSDFIPADLVFNTEEDKNNVANRIRNFYFGNESIQANPKLNYLNYFGDHMVMRGLLNSAEMHSANSCPIYLMEFAYKGNLGSHEEFYDELELAGHGDVIKHAILNKQIKTNEDRLTVKKMTKIVTNFMNYGNPVPETSDLLPVYWPSVQPNEASYLHFGKELTIRSKPYCRRKMFWDRLYSKFKKPHPVAKNSFKSINT